MSEALYRKWRPQVWEDIVGQPHVVRSLRNAISGGHLGHAYLFAGPRGTGKTTAARLLAKSVNCLDADLAKRPCNKCEHCKAANDNRFLDLIEIDAASQNSVEGVRDLRDKINFTPNQGKYKVYIIDEVHMFSGNAFNALLKTLEEPPPHAIFILATTEIHKIPATIMSRCQRYEFRRVPVDEIIAQLNKIVKAEEFKAEPEALTLIARQATGSMRDAISLLDQLASTGEEITLDLTQLVLGTATSQTVLDLIDAVQKQDPAVGLDVLHAALDTGTDVRTLARQVVDYLRALMLIQMGNGKQVDLAVDIRARAESHAKTFSQEDVLRMVRIFNAAAGEQRGNWQPALPLELALAESMEALAATPPAPPVQTKKATTTAAIETPATESAGKTEKNESLDAGPTTLERMKKEWKKICLAVEDKSLRALLNSGKVVDLKKDTLIIGFASELLRAKVDIPEQLAIIRKAIVDIFKEELVVKCVVSTAKNPIPPDLKADSMVAAAIEKGGKIVDIQE